MEQMPDWMAEETTDKKELSALSLADIVKIAERSAALEVEIDAAAAKLEELEAEQNRILRHRLPEALETLGLTEFKMEDGSKVSVQNALQTNISAANKPLAFAWLREHDFDGIIKTKVSAQFGKGESESAQTTCRLLEEAGIIAEVDESVHAATLKAFVKERLEAGDSLPTDVFGIFEFKQAKISKPRTKK